MYVILAWGTLLQRERATSGNIVITIGFSAITKTRVITIAKDKLKIYGIPHSDDSNSLALTILAKSNYT
jgi:hypothetical protein